MGIRRLYDWLFGGRQPAGREEGAAKGEYTSHFEALDDDTLVMSREGSLAVKLYRKEGFGGGTRFSYFGFLGPQDSDLVGEFDSLEGCVAVLVLSESPPDWHEFLGTGCRIGCMAKIYNVAGVGNELALRLDFEQLDRQDNTFVFVISTSGGSFDPERRWVSLLMSSSQLMVLPSLDGYESAFGVPLTDEPALRQEMMKALI